METLEFYFDFSSPNAYFSAVQLRRLSSQHEALDVEWKPVFLGGIMQQLETTPPAMQNQAKADYLMTDLRRWSEYYEIPLEFPDTFPVNSLPALRTYLIARKQESGAAVDFAMNVFRACWADSEDINDDSVLGRHLPGGLSETIALPEDRESDAVKKELKDLTDRAIERGVFGCPTFFVDDEMFWGKDRLDFVKRRLNLD